MGGGTTKVGDPSRQGRERASSSTTATIAANMAGIQRIFDRFLTFGDGADRRRHGQQRRLARRAQLHRLPARLRPPLLGQPHARPSNSVKLRLEREQPLQLPRVQLHDPAGLRLPGAGAAPRLRPADGRLRPVGQHRQRRRAGPPRRRARAVRPDLAAASPPRRARRWARPPPGAVWLNAERAQPYDYWQFWRNTEDADVGRFLKLFTELPLDEIARLEALARRRDQRGQEDPRRSRRPRWCHGARRRRGRRRDRAQDLRGRRASATPCRPSTCRRPSSRRASPRFELFRRAGLAAINGEARRLIKGGGARVNDEKLERPRRAIRSAATRSARRRHQAVGRPQAQRSGAPASAVSTSALPAPAPGARPAVWG